MMNDEISMVGPKQQRGLEGQADFIHGLGA